MRRLLCLPLLAVAAAGCGGSDEEAAEPAVPGQVRMVGIAYQPSEITAKVGETVTFVNEDTVKHDVDATSGSDFESELVGKGGTIELTPDQPGTIEFVCSIHPNMTGTLTVTE
jgi:plastocyanin